MASQYRKYFFYLNENSQEELKYILADHPQHPNGPVGWKGKIVWMSPDKFLSLAKPITYVNLKQVEDLEKKLINKIPLDYLQLFVDMKNKKVMGHEGRHRAMAAKKLGIESVPVFVFVGSNYARVPSWSDMDHDIVNNVKFSPES
jgi:hypothetical protein